MEDREFERLAKMVKDACKHCVDPNTDCDGCPGSDRCTSKFHADVLIVIEGYEERLAAQKSTQPLDIKGERDEALLNLYKHYNRITALKEVDYTAAESMRILIDAIEKLEHARHMEASDEIAKMAFEKLEKFARPMPEIKMDVEQFEEIEKRLQRIITERKGQKNDA